MKKTTVTQLVDFAKCERLAILKLAKAEPLDAVRRKAVIQGEAVHRQTERAWAVDGRCFVASFAFGPDAVETRDLRRFRDGYLQLRVWGRWSVAVYYLLSPVFVRVARRCPGGLWTSRALARLVWRSIRTKWGDR